MRDDLQALVVFARLVEAGSFTAAARALGTTTSHISKRIARLEEELGVRLVERTTRSVAVTEAGRALYEQSTRILGELDGVRRSVAQLGTAPRGFLRVLVDEALADRAVAPLMPALLAQNAGLRLDLVSGTVDGAALVALGFDAAVRIGAAPDDSSMLSRRVGSVDTVVCAAPRYLEAEGAPATLDALARYDCLHLGGRALADEWTLQGAAGPVAVPVRARAQLGSIATLREAAVAGLGLIHVPRIAVADELRDGRLQPVLDEHARRGLPVQTLQPAGRQRAPKAAAFVELLARELPERLRRAVANSSTAATWPATRESRGTIAR